MRFGFEKIKAFLADEDGQSMVEYALIIGLISVVLILAVTNLGQAMFHRFSKMETEMKDAVADRGETS